MALIETRSFSVNHRIREIDLSLESGELLGLIGPNGAGKSTLLNALGGTEHCLGELWIEGQAVHTLSPEERARRVGLQPQSVTSAWSLPVSEVVALGRMPWGDEDPEIIRQAMAQAEVASLAQRRVDELSGGERARVWLARVLAGRPKVLLADEPIASLDLHYQLAVMEILKNYARAGNGVILAIHDLSLAARYCDRICLLHGGEMSALGSPKQVLTAPLLSAVFGVPVEVDLERTPPIVLPR
jgi:iron complex transport system ATP-binding protein